VKGKLDIVSYEVDQEDDTGRLNRNVTIHFKKNLKKPRIEYHGMKKVRGWLALFAIPSVLNRIEIFVPYEEKTDKSTPQSR